MPFTIGELELTNEVRLAPSSVLADGAVTSDGDLTVSVNNFYYDISGTKGRFLGAINQAVSNNNTNYVYLDFSGNLVINTSGYPTSTLAHIRLARVIAAGGVIVRIILERALLTSAGAATVVTPDDTFVFGASSVGTSATTRFLPFGHSSGPAPITTVGIRSARNGTLSNLRVRHNTPGIGGSISYTLRKNGVDTALTASCPASASGCVDLVDSVTVNADDIIDLTVTKVPGISTSPIDITATIEFNS
jgi:hypothetical protein